MTNTSKRTPNKPLKIFSANVGRGAVAHEIALNEAHSISADVILIQEPYIFKDRTRRITKRHPSYIIFSPINDWTDNRPRVMSYIRKGACLHSEQGHTAQSSDLLLLKLTTLSGKTLHILNIYNAPPGSSGGGALQTLYSLSLPLHGNLLLLGDLNLHHTRWQPSWPRGPSQGAEKFVD